MHCVNSIYKPNPAKEILADFLIDVRQGLCEGDGDEYGRGSRSG